MMALWVLGFVLLALWLMGMVRLGGQVEYSEGGLRVRARVGRLWVQIIPIRQKKKRPVREKKKQALRPPGLPLTKGNSFETLRAYLPLVAEAAGWLRSKVRIDQLELELLVAGENPADTAMAFGWANAAIGVMIPLLENSFIVKERNIQTGLSFGGGNTQVRLTAALSLTIGQSVALGWRLAVQLLQVAAKQKRTQKEAV